MFLQWRLLFVRPEFEIVFMSPFWRLDFGNGFQIWGKFVHSCITDNANICMALQSIKPRTMIIWGTR